MLLKQSIAKAEGRYILKIPLEFNTPEDTSDFGLGGFTNSWGEWKNKDSQTLDDLYRE